MVRTHMDQQLQPQGIEECRPWLLVPGQKEQQPLSLREQGWRSALPGRSLERMQECGQAALAPGREHCPPVLAGWSPSSEWLWCLRANARTIQTAHFGINGVCHHIQLGLEVSILPGLIGSVTSRDPPFLLILPSHNLPHNTHLELLVMQAAVALTMRASPAPPLALLLLQAPAV